jgi:hypothetical protein
MAEKTTVFAFGRMNPPTVGHEKLVNKVKEIAKEHGAEHLIVLSHTQDKITKRKKVIKNPLSPQQKLKHAKRFFPKTNLKLSSEEAPTFLQHAQELHKSGTSHLVMVAGSDRIDEYKKKLSHYNGRGEGKLFNFKSMKVVSAGERDPDAEGVEGMSASKMREHAKNNNFDEFKKGVPAHVPEKHAKELFNDVRRGMHLTESFANWVKDASVLEENKYRTASGAYEKNPRNKSGLSKKYSGNLSHSTQLARKSHWNKTSKMADNNPAAYTPAPGDKGTKTKESVYTKRYRERFGEEAMKIPYLLMSNEQKVALQEKNGGAEQITYLNTKTQNFDMCPKAYDAFKALIGTQAGPEMKMMRTTKELHSAVSAGLEAKPDRLRHMQFKQYLGL